ncbi:hypothetical protein D3C78_1609650 [compost metagenome]
MFGQGHAAIAAAEQQKADGRCGLPLRPGRRGCAAPAQKAIQQAAGNDEAHARHQHRRPRLHANADEQVGGTPDQVEREEGANKQQRETTGGRHGR